MQLAREKESPATEFLVSALRGAEHAAGLSKLWGLFPRAEIVIRGGLPGLAGSVVVCLCRFQGVDPDALGRLSDPWLSCNELKSSLNFAANGGVSQ